ncbi:hypothetical protein D9M73_271550 [compost metagenome]
MILQGALEFVGEGSAPPVELEDRQAAVAFADDDLGTVDLGRHGQPFDLDFFPRSLVRAAGMGRHQGVVVHRGAAAGAEQHHQAQ